MKQFFIACLTALLGLCTFGQKISAQNSVEQNVYFNTTNQGWYKSGIPSYSRKEYLLGQEAHTFVSFGEGDADVVRVSGKMGMDFDMYYEVLSQPDGRVDVNFPVKVKFDLPTDYTYGCGEEVPIATSYTPLPGYSITSSPPQFKMLAGVRAKAGVWTGLETYFGDADIVNYGNGGFKDANNDNYDSKMKGGEQPFFGFDTQNGVYTPFQHGLPYTIPQNVTNASNLSGTIDYPFAVDPPDQIIGNTIVESATKEFLNLGFDPVNFLADLVGIPLSASGSIDGIGSAGYSLFSAPLNFYSSLDHSLEFNPTVNITMNLDRTYNFRVRDQHNQIVQYGTGNAVTMLAGETLLVTVPDDNQPITVTPHYSVDNQFTTHIRYDADLDLNLRAFEAYAQTISIEICDPTGILDAVGVDDCYTIGPWGVSVGPLFHERFDLYDFGYDFYPPTTRELGGFQEYTGTPFILRPDKTAPVVTTKNITIYIPDAGGQVIIIPQDVVQSASDAHGGTLRYLNVTPNTFDCANLGPNQVTVRVDDSRCNETVKTATVTVVDRTKPSVNCKPSTVYLDDYGATGIVTNDVFESGWDNCGQVNHVSVLPNTFYCNNLGVNTVTFLANDGHGNTNTCTAAVTVVDNKPPVLVCQPKTVYLDDNGQGSIVLADVLQSSYDNCGTVNVTQVSKMNFNCSDLGNNTVTVYTNDGHGNNANCNATVTVLDKVNPTVECKYKVEVVLNAAGQGSIVPADIFKSGADNCGIVNLQSVAPSTFNCSNLGANLVVLTVNDGHGNTSTCSMNTLSVVDITLPTMLCRNISVNLNALGEVFITPEQLNNGSYDNCSISGMTINRNYFNCSNLGANLVTLTGRDQSGNENTCSATVTVRDQIAPVAKCKNITANLGANGSLTLLPSAVDNGSGDNCSFSTTVTPNTFSCASVGANTVTLRATDSSNNSSTCTAVVTVKDVTPPTAICRSATVYLNDVGQGSLRPEDVNNSSTDACGIASYSLNKTQFNCSELQGSPWNVVLTVKDIHNNTSTCLASVTVRDAIAPTAICKNVSVQLGPNGSVTVNPANLADDSFDNCSVWSYSPLSKVYTTANLGNNNLSITVKDWSGNASTCVSVVTVLPYGGNLGGSDDRDAAAPTPLAFLLYPNPTTGDANLQFELEADQLCTIRAFDASGRLVFQRQSEGLKGENVVPITMQGVAPGVYLIEFTAGKTKKVERLIVND